MLQHMRSHPSQFPCPHMPDLYGYSALIHMGRVASLERFELATRAVNKLRRFWPGEAQLIVALAAGRVQPRLNTPTHCSFHAAEGLRDVINDYRRLGSLLIPDQNEPTGNAVLHALASGVPLDALNFRAPDKAVARLRHGDAFFGVGRACDL